MWIRTPGSRRPPCARFLRTAWGGQTHSKMKVLRCCASGRSRSNSVHRLDSAVTAGPDHLVQLELEPNGQALIEDPRCEQSGIQPMRDVVRRRGGREEDRPGPRVDLG